MNKFFLSLLLVLYSLSFCAQDKSDKSETYFLTFSVKYGLKKEGHVQRLYMDVGTLIDHPLYGKVKNIEEEKIAIGNLSDIQVFSNEVDVLSYLVNNGWEIVKIQDISELSKVYKQYLMEYRKTP